MKHLVFLFSFVIVVSIAYISPSFANDVEVFLKQLEEIAEKKGRTFSYTLESSNDDGDAIIKNFEMSDGKDKSSLSIAELLVSKGQKIGDKGFKFDGLVANSVHLDIKEVDGDTVDVKIDSLNFAGVEYPDLSNRQHPLWPVNIEAAAVQTATATSTNDALTAKFDIPSMALAGLKHTGDNTFSLTSFVLSPLNGDFKGEKNASGTFSFEGITLSGAKYIGEFAGEIGSLNLGAIAAAGITPEKETLQFDFAGMSLQNLYFPGGDDSRPFISPNPTTVSVGALKFALASQNVMGWDGANGTSTFDPSSNILNTKGGWQNLFIDFSKLPLEEQQKREMQPMFDLGYEKLSMNIDYTGTWDITSGLVDISKFGFDVSDAFVFDLNLSFSGYTEALARQISKLSNQAQLTQDPKQQQALGLQILALMTGLSINDMSIKLEDRSLLNKVIEYQASKQNQDADQIRGIAGPMVGIMLAPFQIPEFASNLSTALTTFMQGNKSIMLALKPSPPVNGAEMAALIAGVNAGSTTPAELLRRFNVTVGAQ